MKKIKKSRIKISNIDDFKELLKSEGYIINEFNEEIFKEEIRDIFTKEDHKRLVNTLPEVDKIMIGRGLLANPGLIDEIKNDSVISKEKIKEFHDEILNNYIDLMNDDKNVLFKMKEVWGYMIHIFSDNKKYAKKIRKSQKLSDYNEVVLSLFEEQDIEDGSGLFTSK